MLVCAAFVWSSFPLDSSLRPLYQRQPEPPLPFPATGLLPPANHDLFFFHDLPDHFSVERSWSRAIGSLSLLCHT